MAQTNINVRIDEELKQEFDELCTALGMNMSTAFTLFVKTSVREQRIPFALKLDPFYSESNIKRLHESIDDLNRKGGTAHELIEKE